MGIEAAFPVGTQAAAVAPQRTPASPAELRAAVGRAYTTVTGRTASSALIDTLAAQASLETGNGARMYNFNFGGIKGAGPHGQTANCLTHEVIGGRDVTVRQGFRAYSSIDEGAEDYVRVLTNRFGPALSKAQTGDVDGFAHALKQAGYYTASEADYASALRSLSGQKSGGLLPVPTAESIGAAYPSSGDVSRLLDALGASALRIATPDHHEDE